MAESTAARLALVAAMAGLEIGWLWVRSSLVGEAAAGWIPGLIAAGVLAAGLAAAIPSHATRRADDWIDSRLGGELGPRIFFLLSLCLGTAGALVQQAESWDEPHLLAASRIVAERGVREFFLQYAGSRWLGPNHPPLVPLAYGFAMWASGVELLGLRLATVVIGAATIATCVMLLRETVGRVEAALAGFALLAAPLFLRMCSAVMNDVILTFFFVSAMWITLRLARGAGGPVRGAWLGFVIGAGCLVKYTMLLAIPVLVAVLWSEGRLRSRWPELAIAVTIALAMLAVWFGFAWKLGILEVQFRFFSRAGTMTARSAGNLWYTLDAFFTKLPSGLGVYQVPLLAIGAVVARRRGGPASRLLFAWIALVSAPLLITLPDNRYFLPCYPAFAALIAIGATRVRVHRSRVFLLAGLLCAVTLAFYARTDLGHRAFLFRSIFQGSPVPGLIDPAPPHTATPAHER